MLCSGRFLVEHYLGLRWFVQGGGSGRPSPDFGRPLAWGEVKTVGMTLSGFFGRPLLVGDVREDGGRRPSRGLRPTAAWARRVETRGKRRLGLLDGGLGRATGALSRLLHEHDQEDREEAQGEDDDDEPDEPGRIVVLRLESREGGRPVAGGEGSFRVG